MVPNHWNQSKMQKTCRISAAFVIYLVFFKFRFWTNWIYFLQVLDQRCNKTEMCVLSWLLTTNPNPGLLFDFVQYFSQISLELHVFLYVLSIFLFWPRIFIFCFVFDTEKLDYMLKTEIASRIRIRGQIWNFWNLGRISIEILDQKSRIWKSSSKTKKCQTPEFKVMFFWKPLFLRTRRNKIHLVYSKKIRVPLASTRG